MNPAAKAQHEIDARKARKADLDRQVAAIRRNRPSPRDRHERVAYAAEALGVQIDVYLIDRRTHREAQDDWSRRTALARRSRTLLAAYERIRYLQAGAEYREPYELAGYCHANKYLAASNRTYEALQALTDGMDR